VPVGIEGWESRRVKIRRTGWKRSSSSLPDQLPQFSRLAVAEVNTCFCLEAAADFVGNATKEESCRRFIDLVAASRGI
jgi:hypothetical protein